MKINHFIGGILLIAGTTIGAGMLAIPVSTSFIGFFPSLLLFFICWLVMLCSAYFFLDVNLSLEGETNFISMAHKTLGTWGQVVSWVVYLLLLYSLTAAYIAASVPLFTKAFKHLFGMALPFWLPPFFLPLVFGGFVYLGTIGVDIVNRFLMMGLILSYIFLVGFLPEHVDMNLLEFVDFKPLWIALPVIITSFGYHIIIPTLTTYMRHDKKKLRWIILLGSLLPLFVYIIWQVLILGAVPLKGEQSLMAAWEAGKSATEPLVKIIRSPWIRTSANFFSFFAIVTSFLGVSLSLSDFLTDGFHIKKSWEGRVLACLLTFIPPLGFVFSYPRGFIVALEYAGAFVAILLIMLPALMAWHLKTPKFYCKIKGRILLVIVVLFAFLVVVADILDQWGYFNTLTFKP